MSALVGIVSLVGRSIDPRLEQRFRELGDGRSSRAICACGEGALMAQWPGQFLSRSKEISPLSSGGGRLLFAADARLDNRSELGARLALSGSELQQIADSDLMLRLFRRFGDDGIAHCLGAFAFAMWDADERRLVLGRDCLGNRALYFHRGDGFVAFATTLKALLAVPDVPRDIDERAMANYIALNFTEPRYTLYRGVERVPSRTLVTIDRKRTTHRHYWSPNFDAAPPYKREQDYIERARELLDQAVAAATADTPRVAISTSGGLDSSAIAATAARLGRAESITCFCVVPPENMQLAVGPHHYLDEREKVEALARMHPALKVEFCDERELSPYEENATRLFLQTAMPVRAPAKFGPFYMLGERLVETGHSVKLVGNKGNFGLSWTGEFSLLSLMRRGELIPLIREFIAASRQNGRGVLRTFGGDILRPGVPTMLRRQLHRLRGRDPDRNPKANVLNPAMIAELGLAREWFAAGFDPWREYSGWSPAHHRARFLFDHNQAARDNAGQSISIRGFDVRDPHGDRRLLEFLLMVPEPMYRRDGVARSFARTVLSDRLPPEIINERRKGYQSANWFRRLNARRADMAAEIERLEASPLASRLLDVSRIKRLWEIWPHDENAAELGCGDFCFALPQGIQIGQFIRWVEGGNA